MTDATHDIYNETHKVTGNTYLTYLWDILKATPFFLIAFIFFTMMILEAYQFIKGATAGDMVMHALLFTANGFVVMVCLTTLSRFFAYQSADFIEIDTDALADELAHQLDPRTRILSHS